MWYHFPIPFIGLLLLGSLVKNRGDLLSPANILCGFYFIVCVASLFIDINNFVGAYDVNDIRITVLGFTLLLIVALSPCFFIRKPDTSVLYAYAERARPVLFLLSLLGIYGFAFHIPYALQGIVVNTYVLRELREAEILTPSPLLTAAVVPSTFFALYGLLLSSPIASRCGRFTKMGLLAGFLCYALNNLCQGGRDWVIQYLFLFVFYCWMFGKTWERRLKRLIAVFAFCMALLGIASFTKSTLERFGDQGLGTGVVEGTVSYLGQQVFIFVETVAKEDFTTDWPQIMLPMYYTIAGGEMADRAQYFRRRTERYEHSFGTFLASFYPVGGWGGLTTFAVAFGLLFSGSFAWCLRRGKVSGYVALLLLYYQFMFQGAFSWFMYGRAWNVYVVVMLLGAFLAVLSIGIPRRRGQGNGEPKPAANGTQVDAWRNVLESGLQRHDRVTHSVTVHALGRESRLM